MELLSSKKELEVMEVFWENDEPLSISGIIEKKPSLNKNTTNIVLKNLHKAGYIYVAEIVQTKTVLARAYKAAMTREECIARELGDFNENRLALSMVKNILVNSEIKMKESFIQELETLITQYRFAE